MASGGLWGLAFPPLSWWPVAWVALAPLFWALGRVSPARGALCGGAWAAAATLSVAWWFPATLAGFFGGDALWGWLGLLALALVDAAPYALFGSWLAFQARRGPVSPFVAGAGFTAAEFVRASGWIANPFALAAITQVGSPFAQVADLVGPFGVGWLLATGNAVFAGVASGALAGRWPRRERLAFAALAVVALAYAGVRLSGPLSPGESLRVALVQPGLAPELRHQPARRIANLERQLALTRSASADTELVFWPEYAVDFYLRESSAARDRLLGETRDLEFELVVGAPHYRLASPEPDYYTSVFVLSRGEVAARYDKMHLVPFAESAPLGERFAGERARYRSGSDPRVLPTRRALLGAFLCAEALFPDVARNLARGGATLLVNPSNDGWYAHRAAALHVVQAAALRAIENRRTVVRPAAAGPSAVIEPTGRVHLLGTPGQAAALAATVRTSRVTTLYQRVGDLAGWLALGVVAASLALPVRIGGGTR